MGIGGWCLRGLALLLLGSAVAASAGSVCVEAEAAAITAAPMRITDASGKPPPPKTVPGASSSTVYVPQGRITVLCSLYASCPRALSSPTTSLTRCR